jgi:hypothetical protein
MTTAVVRGKNIEDSDWNISKMFPQFDEPKTEITKLFFDVKVFSIAA